MSRNIVYGIFLIATMIFFAVGGNISGSLLSKRWGVQIINFDVPDEAIAGKPFLINITIQKNRLLPQNFSVQVDLLGGITGSKTIGVDYVTLRGIGKSVTKVSIPCIFREGDINWYTEEYNVQVSLFRNLPHLGWTSTVPITSTMRGIHVKSTLQEKNKVHFAEMNVTQNLGEEDTKFIAKVNVSNNGSFDAMTWVCIDLIQKPSVIPQVEGIINIPALTSEKIELGKSNMTSIKSNTTEYFSIPCYLRKTEKNKNEFYIQALVYVDIDGVDYQVDASTYYGIFNEQPICQGSWCVIIILGAIFGALIAVGIIAVIIRILYPLYRIKKVKLKEERKRIDNKINR